MWDFIKHILQVIWDTFLTMGVTAFTMRFYNKKIMNPNSIWYYKSVIEKIKLKTFVLKITILILLSNILRVFGFKPSKESTEKLMIAIVFIIITIAVMAFINEDKKKKTPLA